MSSYGTRLFSKLNTTMLPLSVFMSPLGLFERNDCIDFILTERTPFDLSLQFLLTRMMSGPHIVTVFQSRCHPSLIALMMTRRTSDYPMAALANLHTYPDPHPFSGTSSSINYLSPLCLIFLSFSCSYCSYLSPQEHRSPSHVRPRFLEHCILVMH